MTEDKTQADSTPRGEGDLESDHRYRKDTKKIVEEGKVEEAAEKARNMSEEESRESLNAEDVSKSRARGEDAEIAHKTKQRHLETPTPSVESVAAPAGTVADAARFDTVGKFRRSNQ